MVSGKSIAIIPARGGSTRIPRKNIMKFFGKPMIAYVIEACLNSKCFDRVIVSTDDGEIAQVARDYGADVPFLRTQYADNVSPVSEAVLFSLKQAEQYYNEKYDYVAQLMPNCPIRSSNTIKSVYNNFFEKKIESQITCFKFGFMNPWWALKLDVSAVGTKLLDIPINIRSQDLEELFCPTGYMWICKKAHLEENKSFYGNHRYFEIDWKYAVDIDNYEDLELAKAVYLMMHGEKV